MARSAPVRIYHKRRKQPKPEAGTALAIIDTDKSEAHVDVKHTLNGWGGKRNSSARVSKALRLATANAIIEAAYHAIKVGLPLNRFLTIHLERAGLTDADAVTAIGSIMKLAKDWMQTKGQVIAHVWVRENDSGDGSKGSHVHILYHCPDTLPIGRMWRRWLRKVSSQPCRRYVIKSKRIGGTVNAYANFPDVYLQNLDGVLAYVCKGVSPTDAAMLGLPKQEAGGWIIGKRAGWSQNIGAKSRVLITRAGTA
jgi:hypothetical protein